MHFKVKDRCTYMHGEAARTLWRSATGSSNSAVSNLANSHRGITHTSMVGTSKHYHALMIQYVN